MLEFIIFLWAVINWGIALGDVINGRTELGLTRVAASLFAFGFLLK